MKTKGSFILKALTALVLAVLMLFGTVSTSLAAVVENAGIGANADLAETGDLTVFWLKGTDVGSNWTANASGIQFNASGWVCFTTTKQDADFKLYRDGWGNDSYKGCGKTISSFDTQETCYKNGGNGTIGFPAGKYAIQISNGTEDWNDIGIKLFPVYTLTEETVLYLDFSNWWTKDEPTYLYANFLKPDGTTTAALPAYRLDSYTANNDNTTTQPNGNTTTGQNSTHFVTLPAGDYIGLNHLFRKSSASPSGSNRNDTGTMKFFDLSNNINTTRFSGSNIDDFAFDGTKKVDPGVTVAVNDDSDVSIDISESATLSASVTSNGLLSVADSYTYSVTSANSSNAVITGNVFTASRAGTYTVKATAAYHAKGFSDITGTADSTNTVTITVINSAPYISNMGSDDDSIDVGKTTTITTSIANYNANCTIAYEVFTTESGSTSADSDGYSLVNNSIAASTTATFTGKKPGTYWIVAKVSESGVLKDTYTTRISVGVNIPSISRANISDLAVNSETPISPSVTENIPQYYYFEYAFSNTDSEFKRTDQITGTYFDIENGSILAKKPTASPVTVYYRIKAGTDEEHITYTSTASSFQVTVATPTVTFAYPAASGKMLLDDISETASLNNLNDYGVTAADVSWAITAQTVKAGTDYEGVLDINAKTGKLKPLGEGTATITATVKFNDSYTDFTVTNTITVEAAYLEVFDKDDNADSDDKLTISTVHSTSGEDLAIDYDNTVKFKVKTNANEGNYAGIASVHVRQQIITNDYTINGGHNMTVDTAMSDAAQEITVTANKVGTYRILVEYFPYDEATVPVITKTITLVVTEYETWLTIYFSTPNDDGTWTIDDTPYAYVWEPGVANTAEIAVPYGKESAEAMVLIGTVGTDKVFAQNYYKKDIMGTAGHAHKLLFKGNNDLDNWNYGQTVDAAFPTGKSAFDNYQYFKGGAHVTDNNATKVSMTTQNYGCLLPKVNSAELTIDGDALPNATNFNTTMKFSVVMDKYIGTGDYEPDAIATFTDPTYVTLTDKNSASVSGGEVKLSQMDLTATAKTTSGTDTFSGYIYFQNDEILETPEKTEAARAFIAQPYTAKSITVTNVKSTIHLRAVKMDTDSYTEIVSPPMTAGGTLNEEAYINRADLNGQNDLGEEVSVTAGDLEGYTLIGYYKSTEEITTMPANTSPQETGDSIVFTANEIKGSGDNITSDYYVYAMYRKVYSISISKSYKQYENGAISFLAAPAHDIVITRDGNVIAKYEFDNSQEGVSTELDDSDPPVGCYGDGTVIPYAEDNLTLLAGDIVEMHYSTLASSDKIESVFYSNDYAPNDPDYWRGTQEVPGRVIDQTNHYVTFTITGVTKHISIALGNKHRITFKDKEGYKTVDMNIGGYYADGETVNFTAMTASSAVCEYDFSTPTIKDPSGNIVGGITFDRDTGLFHGTMPATDVIIDLGVKTNFRMRLGTKMLSDMVGGEEYIDKTSGTIEITGTTPAPEAAAIAQSVFIKNNEAYTADSDNTVAPVNTDGAVIEMGSEVVYSITPVAGYTFLGWYRGNSTGPDLKKGLINAQETFAFKPTANTYIWAVSTRDFYIAGNFTYDKDSGTLTHVESDATNNNPANWTTEANYYRMDYDPVENAYAITFNSFKDHENNDLVSTRSSNANTNNTNFGAAEYSKIFLFKCYRSPGTGSAVGDSTDWNKVTKYDNSYIQWPKDNKLNDNMYYGKMNGDGGAGMFEFSTKTTNGGYNVPVTLYFKPEASKATWYVKATRVWPDIYISDGYDKIDSYRNTSVTEVTEVKIGDAAPRAITSSDYIKNDGSYNGTMTSDDGYEQPVNKYNFKFNTDVEITLSKQVGPDHEVVGFVVYDLTEDRVYPAPAEPSETANTYTATVKIGLNKLYICPVIWHKDGAGTVTVNVDASQLVMSEFGDLISCYPWYSGTNSGSLEPNGKYPGQLMYPSNDAKTWSARFVAEGSDTTLSGITFANYTGTDNTYINDHTWLGRYVLSSGASKSGEVIEQYNRVARSSNDNFNKSNISVQSYDYREPYAFYINDVKNNTSDPAVLSFAFKTGNTDYLGSAYPLFADPTMNVLNVTGVSEKKTPRFEYLTDSSGKYYMDLNGNTLDDQPTPSFYIIAKGQVYYNNRVMLYEGRSGATSKVGDNLSGIDDKSIEVWMKHTIKGATTGESTASSENVTHWGDFDRVYEGTTDNVSQEFGVQWYIYDASGKFITDVLSAGYADNADDGNPSIPDPSYIGKVLEDKGYAVNLKSVGISYDYPRYYSDTNIYRFEGQWYATKKTTPVYVNAKVGIYTNGSFDLSESNNEAYGTAEVYYDYEKGDPNYLPNVVVDPSRSNVKIALGDAAKSPVYLNASKENFIGWFYEDQDGEMKKVSSDYELFYPNIVGDSTYYAIYEVKANYTFIYLDRNGNKTQYVVDVDLNSKEIKGYIGNGNKANIPTFNWTSEAQTEYNSVQEPDAVENPYLTALREVENVVSSYQYGVFVWPGSLTLGTNAVADSTQMSLQITAQCPKARYAVTIKKIDTDGTRELATSSVTVESGKVLTFNGGYYFTEPDTYVYHSFDTTGIKYWSSDRDGLHPLTTVASYGLVITHGGTIYGQTKQPAFSDRWKPSIESLSKTRKKTKSSDTMYLDFNSYFVNTQGTIFHDIEENKPHYGIIIAYDKLNDKYVNISDGVDLSVSTLKKYIKYFSQNPNVKSGTVPGTNIVLTCYDYCDDAHISNRNRSNFVISGDYSMLNGVTGESSVPAKKLTVYTYVYDDTLNSGKIALSSTSFNHTANSTTYEYSANQFKADDFNVGSTTVFE